MRKLVPSKRFICLSLISYLLSLSYGCNGPSPEKKQPEKIVKEERKVSLIQLLLGDGNKEFRAVDLGIDSKSLLKDENKVPDENDTDNIYYTFPIDTLHPDSVNEAVDSANYFQVTYSFDKDKLNEIDEDIITSSDSTAAMLAVRLTDYYDSKYGDNIPQNDSKNWDFTRNGKKIRISLSDKSEEYDYGKIALVIYSEEI